MGLFGELLPAEYPDPDKGRFQEEGRRGLDGQQGSENVAHVGRIARPVGTELEFEGNAGDHPYGEVDQKNLTPEFGHGEIGLVAGAHVLGFHVGDDPTQAEGKGDEKKMKGRGCIKLQARKHDHIH